MNKIDNIAYASANIKYINLPPNKTLNTFSLINAFPIIMDVDIAHKINNILTICLFLKISNELRNIILKYRVEFRRRAAEADLKKCEMEAGCIETGMETMNYQAIIDENNKKATLMKNIADKKLSETSFNPGTVGTPLSSMIFLAAILFPIILIC